MINFESLILLIFQIIIIAFLLKTLKKNKENGLSTAFLQIWIAILVVTIIVSWIHRYERSNIIAHLKTLNENEDYYISNHSKLDCSDYIIIKKDCEKSLNLINRIIELNKQVNN